MLLNDQKHNRRNWVAWPLALLISATPLLGASGLLLGRQGLEKTLTQLTFPVAIFWLIVTSWILLSWWTGKSRNLSWAILLWLGFTLCSTAPFPNWCIDQLESQVHAFDPQSGPPLDYLMVLGGGTGIGPRRAELSAAGDRVYYAAQLFLQGRAKHLITSGTSTVALGPPAPDPSQLTMELWSGLGIPAHAITSLPGSNTYQEIESLKGLMPQLKGKRIGLLTSAAHLPRAMRLADQAGLTELIPLAANHRRNTRGLQVTSFIPSSSNLEKLSICQHEWMGWLVGR